MQRQRVFPPSITPLGRALLTLPEGMDAPDHDPLLSRLWDMHHQLVRQGQWPPPDRPHSDAV